MLWKTSDCLPGWWVGALPWGLTCLAGQCVQLPSIRFESCFALNDPSALTTPSGQRRSAAAWAREPGVAYTPTWVFFDAAAREAFRVDSHLRPFHLATSLEYVASGAYRDEPE